MKYAMRKGNTSAKGVTNNFSAQIVALGFINILIVPLTILLSCVLINCPVSYFLKLMMAVVAHVKVMKI